MESLLSAVGTFIASQVVLKFYIEPIREMQRCIAHAAYLIEYFQNIDGCGDTEWMKKRREEAEREYRTIGIILSEKEALLMRFGVSLFVPSRDEIELLKEKFIGLSNSLSCTDDTKETKERAIIKILNKKIKIGFITFKRCYIRKYKGKILG